ncbi:cytochrome P450 [Dichomitus squalens]|nr:cytochrome P450 [Dichomitus squalens]
MRYQLVQAAIVHLFLKKLLEDPERLTTHIRFVFAATMLKVAYGIDIDDGDHEIVRVIDEGVEGTAQAFAPGKFLVDHVPWLEHVPAWFPGAGFQRQFATWRAAQTLVKDVPFMQRRTIDEHTTSSYATVVDQLLKKRNHVNPEYWEELVKSVAAVVYEAGSDTSFSAMQAAFLAMSLHPEVQRKAHAELDAVVGRSRLPDFRDLDSLVYVQAILKEVLRWHTVTPLGIPHRTMKDDVFCGYFVPAGTVLIANIWDCMHDPGVYEDPDDFLPERFIKHGVLNADVLDPICPGRYFAQSTLLLNIASVLHIFNISPPLDNDGRPLTIKHDMTDGFLSYPEDCRCTIKPRSSDASALIVNSQGRTNSN